MRRDGTPGPLTQVSESRPLDAPDGFAIARSGNVFVALAGASQVLVLSPRFEKRFGATRRAGAVLDVFAGERGLPLYKPRIPTRR